VLRFELEQELIEARWRWRTSLRCGTPGFMNTLDWRCPATPWVCCRTCTGRPAYRLFPTYALGNLIAGQLWSEPATTCRDSTRTSRSRALTAARVAARARASPRLQILHHRAAAREVGEPILVAPYIRYLKCKLGDVYGLDLLGS